MARRKKEKVRTVVAPNVIRKIRPVASIRFTIFGIAKGKAMPKVVRNKHTGNVHAIPPTKDWENTIAGQAFKYKPERPLEGPVALGVVVYRPMPKRISKDPHLRELALNRQIFPTPKPDVKNTTAAVEDALNGIFWIDDAHVVQYIDVDGVPFGKYYSDIPRIEILIRPLPVWD